MNRVRFADIDIHESFFDTLKNDYPGFEQWFDKKAQAGDKAFVIRNAKGEIDGFLYVKLENGVLEDVVPPLPARNRLKIGTFKIDAHGTKLGERFLKKVLDHAISKGLDSIYVTVFEKHTGLTRLFDKYGFVKVATKSSVTGESELVLERDLTHHDAHIIHDYPFIHTASARKYLLAIYPEFHTQLLPDSILNNESYDVLKDLSHTNSIHKIYVCHMDVDILKVGDILVIYRTKDKNDTGSAEYRSVVTSIGVVEEIKQGRDFATLTSFVDYCAPYSVFSEDELKEEYRRKYNLRVIKFTYNAAVAKKLIRKTLAENIGLDRNDRWGFLSLTDEQFEAIIDLGGVNASLIID